MLIFALDATANGPPRWTADAFCTGGNPSRTIIGSVDNELFHRRDSPSASRATSTPPGAFSRSRRTRLQAAPEGMQWFVKTEQFCKPFPEVKPHLENHRAWVRSLREEQDENDNDDDVILVSGYRVDAEGKPGGGGLMIFAARDHEAADAFVRQDPLIVNECVDWQLNRWIPETGDINLE